MSPTSRPRAANRRYVDQPATLLLDPLNRADTRPLYVQIADRIRTSIRDGRLPQSRPIPILPVIARRYGVDSGTVVRANRLLAGEGLLRAHPGAGTFVCGLPPAGEPPQEGGDDGP